MTVPVAVSLCDVPATILHLLQIPIPIGIQGRSLLSLLDGNEYNSQIFAEWEEDKMILKSGWKYIQSSSLGKEQLYHLSIDQNEEVNLVSEEKDVVMELKESLSRWMESFEPPAVLETKVEMSETQKEALRALGYID
jgi:arylsulfatase A-like enzyme